MIENEITPTQTDVETSPVIGEEIPDLFESNGITHNTYKRIVTISPTLTYTVSGMEKNRYPSLDSFHREIGVKRNDDAWEILSLPLTIDSTIRLRAGVQYVAEQLVKLGYEKTIQFWNETDPDDFIDLPALQSSHEEI